jgi:hypothetical protein
MTSTWIRWAVKPRPRERNTCPTRGAFGGFALTRQKLAKAVCRRREAVWPNVPGQDPPEAAAELQAAPDGRGGLDGAGHVKGGGQGFRGWSRFFRALRHVAGPAHGHAFATALGHVAGFRARFAAFAAEGAQAVGGQFLNFFVGERVQSARVRSALDQVAQERSIRRCNSVEENLQEPWESDRFGTAVSPPLPDWFGAVKSLSWRLCGVTFTLRIRSSRIWSNSPNRLADLICAHPRLLRSET